MSKSLEKAQEFLRRETAFRLGELLTESSHPKTRNLSQAMETDIPAGIRLLQSVDEDIPPAVGKVFARDAFAHLAQAMRGAMQAGRRIYFTGCGATGRLSILLEAAWRRCWRELEHSHPQIHRERPGMEDRCISVMAGGDFALIKSVEGFEDFPDFGRHQLREAGVREDDVVVAITEGGETPFVIGTAWEGLERGAKVFFVYNNPTEALSRHVQRSREVIEEPRIEKLDLTTGPMAITGSTRMQAVTAELLVVGGALETALAGVLGECAPWPAHSEPGSSREYPRLFERLLEQLSSPDAVDAMARLTRFEEQLYRAHGLVTYVADSALLDVLTDTTERSPTFMVPPFRRHGDTGSPMSWAFVKTPSRPTEPAWRDMLQRAPRGLSWGPAVYEQLEAPAALQRNPPSLDNAEIYRFRIGNESDPARRDAADSALVMVGVGEEMHRLGHAGLQEFGAGYKKTAAITIGPKIDPLGVDEHFHFSCDLPTSPLRLWEHLAVKLVLNTVSTATMVRMGRVMGNAMVWLSPSNKKLIDRGSRLISQVAGCSYERACEVLHQTMEEVAGGFDRGEEVPSPVALAIDRISTRDKET